MIKSKKIQQNDLNPETPVFPISVIASILNVHQRTLRIYDAENILVPQRSLKSRRLYSIDDIKLGKLIQQMTHFGLNLAGVKIFLAISKDLSIDQKTEKFDEISKLI
jgi:MerR family transcriptional regulator, heat shock protein HspR